MYIYNGLVNDDVRMIITANGGSILNNTPEATRALIEELTEVFRQFNKRYHDKRAIRENVNTESKVGKLEDQMQALTSMMRDFMVKGKAQQVKSYGICSFNHPTDACPQLQEEGNEEVSAIAFKTKGFKKEMIRFPVHTTRVERPSKSQVWESIRKSTTIILQATTKILS